MMIAARNAMLMRSGVDEAELEWIQGDGASGFWIPCNVNVAKFEVTFYRTSLASQGVVASAMKGSEGSNVDIDMDWMRNNDTLSRGHCATQHMQNQNVSSSFSAWFGGSAQLSTKLTMSLDIPNATNAFSVGGGGAWTPRTYDSLPFVGLACRAKSNNVVTNFSTVKVCSFKIWESGVAKYDLVPYRVGAVGCLLNKVDGAKLFNAGTGSFILGPDK